MAAMDTDDAASSSFETFATAFRSAKDLDLATQLDAESGTALVFADACARRAAWVRDHPADDHALEDVDALAWDAEQHTWKLIHSLFAYVWATYPVRASLIRPRPSSRRPSMCMRRPSLRSSASWYRVLSFQN